MPGGGAWPACLKRRSGYRSKKNLSLYGLSEKRKGFVHNPMAKDFDNMGPWLVGSLVRMARLRPFLCQSLNMCNGRWSKRIIKFFLSVLGLLFLPLPVDGAEKPVEPPQEIQGFIPVQLRTFSIPTLSGNGWLGRGPLTMVLVVHGERGVSRLCRYMPRVFEAITLTVDQYPVPIINDKYQLDEIGAQLHKAINMAAS